MVLRHRKPKYIKDDSLKRKVGLKAPGARHRKLGSDMFLSKVMLIKISSLIFYALLWQRMLQQLRQYI